MVYHRMICFAASVIVFLSTLVAKGEIVTNQYHGIRPTDPQGFVGLPNPERGFRTATPIGEGIGTTGLLFDLSESVDHVVPLNPDFTNERWILEAEMFGSYGITLAQTYCYLTEYTATTIAQSKLDLIQESFDHLRANGMKAVLRFAYAKDMLKRTYTSATKNRILAHINQLTSIIQTNIDVIYTTEAGFIGAWGEWHSDAYTDPDDPSDYDDCAAIVKKLVDTLPGERDVGLRTPHDRSNVLAQAIFSGQEAYYGSRMGLYNDGFLAGPTDGGTWPDPPYYGSPGNPYFDVITDGSTNMVVGGELFWSNYIRASDGSSVQTNLNNNGWPAAQRMRLHRYSVFSIEHSYSVRQTKLYNIDYWIKNPLTKQEVIDAKMPLSDSYFENQFGEEVERTQFEYIRDHLGYRLELQEAAFPDEVVAGGSLDVDLELINRGFAAPHNARNAYVVLVDMDGNVTSFDTGADPRQWQPFAPGDSNYTPLVHQLGVQVTLPGGIVPGHYQVGFWLPDPYASIQLDPRYAIRLANRDTIWWTDADGEYGINLLGMVEVK